MKEFAELSTLNPFSADLAVVASQWAIDTATKSKYDNRFAQLELNSDAKVTPIDTPISLSCHIVSYDMIYQRFLSLM